jgi:hypothetical protein
LSFAAAKQFIVAGGIGMGASSLIVVLNALACAETDEDHGG